MQIKLDDADFKLAIQQYLGASGINVSVDNLEFKIGRNPTTVGVEITVGNANAPEPTLAIVPEKVAVKKAMSKTVAPEPETEAAPEVVSAEAFEAAVAATPEVEGAGEEVPESVETKSLFS